VSSPFGFKNPGGFALKSFRVISAFAGYGGQACISLFPSSLRYDATGKFFVFLVFSCGQ
jgi:hypothetical protein